MPDSADEIILASAAGVRERAGLRHPPFNLTRILSRCFPGALLTGADLPAGVHGLTRVGHDGAITIFYSRAIREPDQQRLVIAHEIGHLVLERVLGEDRHCGGYELDGTTERRCDRFGEELLAPTALLEREAKGPLFPRAGAQRIAWENFVDRMAIRYQVPRPVIVRRLRWIHAARIQRKLEEHVKAIDHHRRVVVELRGELRRASERRAPVRDTEPDLVPPWSTTGSTNPRDREER